MKKIMMYLAVFVLTVVGAAGIRPAYADFPERPVGFVVIDKTGDVNEHTYTSWKHVVKWAYHFPQYKIVEDDDVREAVTEAFAQKKVKVTGELMAALAEQADVDVLVVAKINEMDDRMLPGSGNFRDSNVYVEVLAVADLYIYKKDGDKFLHDKLRVRETKELGNYEKPRETIRWALSKLVNTMENRPIIR